jgi:NAD(P)-dependent dehydrogenase (short-subunit alcohol dehydrogenase family)
VLIVGATGNIGVAVTIAALRVGQHVIAPVRNSASARKLFEHVGTSEGITAVETDVTTENGLQNLVDRVEAGQLPAFQHVYSSSE